MGELVLIKIISQITMKRVEISLFDGVTPTAIVGSTNANPSVLTTGAHGLTTGDRVLVFGHGVNTTVNGIFKAVVLSTTTLSLKDEFTGADIAGIGIGIGTGAICKAPPIIRAEGMEKCVVELALEGTPTLTLKMVGANGKSFANTALLSNPRRDLPNIGATQSAQNPWSVIGFQNRQSMANVDGATGIAPAGAPQFTTISFENGLTKYMTLILTAWTAGAITAKAVLFDSSR